MNYIDLVIIIITALMVVIGALRGLVVSLLSMLRFSISVPLSFFVSETYCHQVYDSLVKESAYNAVSERLSQSQSVNGIISGVEEFTNSLPSIFSQGIETGAFKTLSIDEISKTVTDTVVEPVALIVIKILLFVITFIVFYIIASILISVFKKMQKKDKAPLKRTNAFLGGVFGLLKAFVFIFTISTIIGYICDIIPQGNLFVKQAENSFLLEFINTHNFLLK